MVEQQEPYKSNVKVVLDLLNYVIESEVSKAAGVNTSEIFKQRYFNWIKNLDMDK